MALADALDVNGTQEARTAIARLGGLASQADLARCWEVSRQRVHQMIREPGFPAPAADVNGQPVWFLSAADRWREYRELCLAEAALNRP